MTAAGFALLLSACGGGSSNSSAAPAPAPTAAASQTPTATANTPTASPTASAQGGDHEVTATETEFGIALSTTTFHPGAYTFVAKDEGQVTHALEIDGPGVQDKSTGDLAPGTSTSLTVTLSAGSYDVYCPVDGHRAKGMETHITVS